MSLLRPERIERRAPLIPADYFTGAGIKGVLLDVDNTLAFPGGQIPLDGVPEWLDTLRAAGLKLAIASNARRRRVQPFAAALDLPFVSLSCKPLPFGLARARGLLGCKRRETVLVGDQLFTDVLGGNLCGIRTVLVQPAVAEQGRLFSLKRRFEAWVLRRQALGAGETTSHQ